jgi:hypothetical protein
MAIARVTSPRGPGPCAGPVPGPGPVLATAMPPLNSGITAGNPAGITAGITAGSSGSFDAWPATVIAAGSVPLSAAVLSARFPAVLPAVLPALLLVLPALLLPLLPALWLHVAAVAPRAAPLAAAGSVLPPARPPARPLPALLPALPLLALPLLAPLLLAAGVPGAAAQPTVTHIEPAAGLAAAGGARITIMGTGFPAAAPAAVAVGRGTCAAVALEGAANDVVCTVPPGVGGAAALVSVRHSAAAWAPAWGPGELLYAFDFEPQQMLRWGGSLDVAWRSAGEAALGAAAQGVVVDAGTGVVLRGVFFFFFFFFFCVCVGCGGDGWLFFFFFSFLFSFFFFFFFLFSYFNSLKPNPSCADGMARSAGSCAAAGTGIGTRTVPRMVWTF